ncbi:MbeB-like, N-term conserved region [Salmonella enterica]|uniref:MbeB-like, N-term conserved region n=1 Tax=Salmonella enterica subsp. arizonae TaxID=59203 RepID=A0A379T0E7_SALER|nr:MbeB family mobilization protein [Salmonella enterica]SUF62592.1 MbeB-like, N-term conserved region [Salmonella enterica]SUG35169.1 MbeB-like, N-term conserved region [Salmonella enterica subsp. arizonae]SUG49854.1 MbeB-like, N-term conserved region [Salmonella enterica subsp. arizonae]VEA48918.1 MbeB-like, N-term conserved region [Salmonella enterica subsp. arizonae]
MSSHLKMATDFRQKSSEQANATGQLLKQEFDRLGTCVSGGRA